MKKLFLVELRSATGKKAVVPVRVETEAEAIEKARALVPSSAVVSVSKHP